MFIEIYTDGSCSGKSHVGGYAFVVIEDGKEDIKVYGIRKETTNNAMELMAIVRAVKYIVTNKRLKKNDEVTIYSDSAYCVNSVEQKWIYFWEKNDWKTKQGEPVKNLELWKEFLLLKRSCNMDISLKKVKGHSGVRYNEIVDNAAKQAITNLNANSISK